MNDRRQWDVEERNESDIHESEKRKTFTDCKEQQEENNVNTDESNHVAERIMVNFTASLACLKRLKFWNFSCTVALVFSTSASLWYSIKLPIIKKIVFHKEVIKIYSLKWLKLDYCVEDMNNYDFEMRKKPYKVNKVRFYKFSFLLEWIFQHPLNWQFKRNFQCSINCLFIISHSILMTKVLFWK